MISFVIPCYGSENAISQVLDDIVSTVKEKIDEHFEYIEQEFNAEFKGFCVEKGFSLVLYRLFNHEKLINKDGNLAKYYTKIFI